MKIILHTYNTCFQNPSGGVQVRVKKVKKLLEENNIIVDFFNPSVTKLTDYDILHIYKLDAETAALVSNAKKNKLKIFISPIIGLNNGRVIDIYMKLLNRFPISTTYKQISGIINNTDMFLTETNKEKEFLCKHYGVQKRRVEILPNGVDKVVGKKKIDIFNVIQGKKKYVLSVGRINCNKNILNLIKAIGPTGIDLVIVGGPDKINGESYYEKCVVESSKYSNVYMLGWLDNNSDLLQSAYQNADTIVLPSYQETFGLVLLEGAVHGAKATFSNTLPIIDYEVFAKCPTFDPSSIDSIRYVVKNTFYEQKNNKLKEELLKEFSWDSIIHRQIDFYEECLNEKSHN